MTRKTDSMPAIHRKTAELLPWYVTGRLPASESDYVEQHLRECLTCRVGLRGERQLSKLIREQDDVGVSPERGISELLTRIEDKRGRRRRRFPAVPRPSLAYGIASLAAIVAVGAILAPSFLERRAELDPGAFETLTDNADLSADRIDIIFADAMDARAIDAFVRAAGAELVGGPTELGRYTIALPSATGTEIDELVRELGADPRVRFAGRNFIDATGEDGDPR